MGRPSDYSQELANRIFAEIAEGKSLRSVCSAEDMPDKTSVFRWLASNKDFSDQYARACAERTEAHQESLLDLGDEAIELAQGADPKAAGAVVQAVRLKADNLKWSMSKMKPKKYGDRLDMTTNGKDLPVPLLHVLDHQRHDEDRPAAEAN